MREILALLPKPSRYIGCEEGSVHKNRSSVSLHIGLAFPDMYEVGMSYLGQKILYAILNEKPDWWAERVFTPCREAGAILKKEKIPLATLESDTPLSRLDVLGFSVTHELCYTNILYMLDLGGIPFRFEERLSLRNRGEHVPLIVAGGGCTLAAEPIAPFVDVMVLGEGEKALPELLQCYEKAHAENIPYEKFLERAARIPGIYVPSFFETLPAEDGSPVPYRLEPALPGHAFAIRRVSPDCDDLPYPKEQPIPFGAVHNRLALEIARGCTRGCRFCQAGSIYRPARERSVPNLQKLLDTCLSSTGYDDVSFLSLSTGDFSALKTLFMSTVDRCSQEQISVSLPSLRVGSIDDAIMERMSGIRRTGATLAPEAGSQRLRDVINKGITEEELILHVQKLFEHGWRQVKLYFMLGLPTETDDDLLAIVDLCRKARDAAGPGIKQLQITAAVSPFVPKPHTPFQWEPQISHDEIRRRVGVLLDAVKAEKRITLRWHEPDMTLLEGIFSRGDRRLAPVLETAYAKGAIFASWMEGFSLTPWFEAMEEHGLKPEDFTGAIPVDAPLAWDHLHSGLSKAYLVREYEKALKEKPTPDCRYAGCAGCGVCDTATPSGLREPGQSLPLYNNRLNMPERDQAAHTVQLDKYGRVIVRGQDPDQKFEKQKSKAAPPSIAPHLAVKAAQLLIRYSRKGPAVYLSQLEMQAILERAMRRAALPLAFSQGYHPIPIMSFGRALPVGVGSENEWLTVMLREKRDVREVLAALNSGLPGGLEVTGVTSLPVQQKMRDAAYEFYRLEPAANVDASDMAEIWQKISASDALPWERETKKGMKYLDARAFLKTVIIESDGAISLSLDWSSGYVSPLALVLAAMKAVGFEPSLADIRLTKTTDPIEES